MENWSLDKSKSSDQFIVPYWLVRGTTDESSVNMKLKVEKISEKLLGTEITIMVPTLINFEEIKAGDELFVLADNAKNQSEKQPVDATSSKRASTSSSSGSKRAKK